MYHYHKLIGSCREHSAQIELRRVVRAFRVSDKSSVHIQIHTAGNAEERDHVILIRICDLKVSAVNAYEIVLLTGIFVAERDLLIHAHPGEDPADLIGCGDHRRFERKLIADIDIERLIVSPELPAGGNIDLIKLCFLRIKGFRHFRRYGIEFEIPAAVQAHHLGGRISLLLRRHGISSSSVRIRDKVAPGGHFVDLISGKCMIVVLIDTVFHSTPLQCDQTLGGVVCAMLQLL